MNHAPITCQDIHAIISFERGDPMRGSYDVLVENRRMQYKFTIRRNITVIRGDSATGKTTLVEMIQEFNDNGPESGISLQCEKECVVLAGRYWQNELEMIHNSIVFIDEGSRFVLSADFARKIQHSDNYYVIITRERLENIPYSVEEIYGIRNSGKYGALQKTYHEMFHLYEEEHARLPITFDSLLGEDSNSGYQFFQACCKPKNIACISANGKSNLFALASRQQAKTTLIIADGAAFGPEMNRIEQLRKVKGNIHLFLPESFEWLLLSARFIDSRELDAILQTPADYVESRDYFSWEQFFTTFLVHLTKGTIWNYQKKKLNPIYLHENNVKKVLIAAAPVLDSLEESH